MVSEGLELLITDKLALLNLTLSRYLENLDQKESVQPPVTLLKVNISESLPKQVRTPLRRRVGPSLRRSLGPSTRVQGIRDLKINKDKKSKNIKKKSKNTKKKSKNTKKRNKNSEKRSKNYRKESNTQLKKIKMIGGAEAPRRNRLYTLYVGIRNLFKRKEEEVAEESIEVTSKMCSG